MARFFKVINNVDNKKGCLLIQLPPSLGKEYTVQLNNLLNCIRKINVLKWNIAIEFRNNSWYNDSTYHMLKLFNAALVIHDMRASATPIINHASDFIYIRFHGPTGNYNGSYSETFLNEYTTYIKRWIKEGKEVYMYFNNTMGDALNNLKTIHSFLHHQR